MRCCSLFVLLALGISVQEGWSRPLKSVSVTFPGDILKNMSDKDFGENYLKRFGYLDAQVQRSGFQSMVSTAKALKKMQRQMGLVETGELDKPTLEAMRQPRCGVPDVTKYKTYQGDPKWDHNDVTYRILNYPSYIGSSLTDDAFAQAFKLWSDVTPLTFTRLDSGTADIMISFEDRDHGDGYPFDADVLAHAFHPGQNLKGEAHFNNAIIWTLGGGPGYNLYITAAHELGHALGLDHSSITDAVMYPTYSYMDNLALDQDDIKGIQHLYGSGQHP